MSKPKEALKAIKPALVEMFNASNGFHRKTVTFHVGLQTPLMCEVEAVNGMASRENYKATALYVSVFGERFRYNGKRFSAA